MLYFNKGESQDEAVGVTWERYGDHRDIRDFKSIINKTMPDDTKEWKEES